MEPIPHETELIEIIVEVSTAFLATAQKATGKGVAETVIEGLEKIVLEALPQPD